MTDAERAKSQLAQACLILWAEQIPTRAAVLLYGALSALDQELADSTLRMARYPTR